MKFLTWQNPEQLFVAQELINKVKSKCCGIKDIFKLTEFLKKETEGYDVVTIGSSAGAYAAIICGSLLHSKMV